MSLPSDEEIFKKSNIEDSHLIGFGFVEGAIWMRGLAEIELNKLRTEAEKLRLHIKFLLSFAPKGEVPKDLSPMFYHTLSYETEVDLQNRINDIINEIEHYSELEKDK